LVDSQRTVVRQLAPCHARAGIGEGDGREEPRQHNTEGDLEETP
jgi:hypothetical protein